MALCEDMFTGGFSSEGASNSQLWCFYFSESQQSAEITFVLLVLWSVSRDTISITNSKINLTKHSITVEVEPHWSSTYYTTLAYVYIFPVMIQWSLLILRLHTRKLIYWSSVDITATKTLLNSSTNCDKYICVSYGKVCVWLLSSEITYIHSHAHAIHHDSNFHK